MASEEIKKKLVDFDQKIHKLRMEKLYYLNVANYEKSKEIQKKIDLVQCLLEEFIMEFAISKEKE